MTLVAFTLLWATYRLGLAGARRADLVTLSIVGTNDVHGNVFPKNGRGGIAVLGGYLKNLRAARQVDGGAVVLLDAGDTFLGTIESNLTEGALVIDAYNALGYTAGTIGNHEFDYGAVDNDSAEEDEYDDPQGAVKARAAQATYPYLAANLLDASTHRPVAWPNVRPSVLVERAGVKVGIIGVTTSVALRAALAPNVRGLEVAPLAPAIAAEAQALRGAGAAVVLVTAHAGGRCGKFESSSDLSSCDGSSEIFEVARNLPTGLVDVIVAGHTHQGLAHVVNGIAITEAFSGGRAFGRVDLVVDRGTGRVVEARPFAPREICLREDAVRGGCDPFEESPANLVAARYEGRPVESDPSVLAAMRPALERVRALQQLPLHVQVDSPLRRSGDLESPLTNLFADALRESAGDADLAISNNAIGGLRTDLPPGPLTFGRLYDVFPFDNRVARAVVRGGDLERVFAEEIRRGRRGALGVSGIRVRAACEASGVRVKIARSSGRPIAADDALKIVTTDFLLAGPGQVFTSVAPPGGFDVSGSAPLVRQVVSHWIQQRGGHLRDDQFVSAAHPRWHYSGLPMASCRATS